MKQNHSISSAQQAQDSYRVKFSKMLDDILRGAETTKDSLQRQISQFSSDISHFQYGELRTKRHHRGQKNHFGQQIIWESLQTLFRNIHRMNIQYQEKLIECKLCFNKNVLQSENCRGTKNAADE